MARGVNKVILVGNLGADPEKRSTQSGTTITTLSVATSESWRDKQTGEQRERTEWHRVKLFGKLGDIAADYLSKGRQVYIEGSIRTDKVQGNDGQTKYFTDIVANEMQMLGGRGEGGGGQGGGFGGGQQQGGYGNQGSSQQGSPQQGAGQGAAASNPAPVADTDGFDDKDIPF